MMSFLCVFPVCFSCRRLSICMLFTWFWSLWVQCILFFVVFLLLFHLWFQVIFETLFLHLLTATAKLAGNYSHASFRSEFITFFYHFLHISKTIVKYTVFDTLATLVGVPWGTSSAPYEAHGLLFHSKWYLSSPSKGIIFSVVFCVRLQKL